MSDKLIAGLVTAALVTPLCALCIVGPVALGSALGWFAAEIGGFGVWTTVLAAVAGAAGVYGVVRRRRLARRENRTDPGPDERPSRLQGSA